MRIETRGIARIQHSETGDEFEINSNLLEWGVVGVEERQMGPETHYEAAFEHEALGPLSWGIWEYPVGALNTTDIDVGDHRVLQDFEIDLVHEPDLDENEPVDRQAQIDVMVEWFHSRFEDPQHEMPYAGRGDPVEGFGNYHYIWGGPYDASEELQARFDGEVPFDIIQEAVRVVEAEGTVEWAPGPNHPDRYTNEDDNEPDVLDELSAYSRRIEAGASVELGSTQELQRRREVAEAADRALLELTPIRSPGGIGHNMPPGPIEDEDTETSPEAIATEIETLKEALEEPAPNVRRIAAVTKRLVGLCRKLKWPLIVVAGKGYWFVKPSLETVRDSANEAAKPEMERVGGSIGQLLGSLAEWFSTILNSFPLF